MEPIFLAKLLGIYFLVVGIIVVLRRSAVMPAIKEMSKHPGMILGIAVIELAAGLAIVINYPWSWEGNLNWQAIISLIGWMLIIESIFYMASPSKIVQKVFKSFNRTPFYIFGGILTIILGAYLSAVGFGFM